MKRVLLLGFVLALGLTMVAQNHLRSGLRQCKNIDMKTMSADPVNNVQASPVVTPVPNSIKSTNVVTVLTLGTSANGLGWGYNGDKKTHLWANDTLKTIVQIHRMGPGSSPPSFSGYLAGDNAGNMGMTIGDWSINWQIYAATLNTGGTYYADAARYPNGALYNPPGNTDPANSYIVYHAPNFLNPDQSSAVWGGYSHGSVKWGNQADSVKILDWYNPPPTRYIPDGFTVTHKGKSFVTDVEYNQGTVVYDEALLYGNGTWNETNHVFDYVYSSIPLHAETAITRPRTPRIAADPSGDILWIACIDDNLGITKVTDSSYLYPVLFKSTDGGQTWSDPIAIQLDGPNGIATIRTFVPQGKLDSLWSPPGAPPRDQIAYTTWTNLDLVVDKWGRPHCVMAVGVGGSSAYSIVTVDSCWGIFDIFPVDKYVIAGTDWCARQLGAPKQFQGLFPSSTYPDDNRPSACMNETGDHVFFTWLDTTDPNATSNSAPDIFARGWNLLTNKLTNANGKDDGTNATYLSDVTQAAAAGDASPFAFTKADGSGHYIPMMCESLTGGDYSQPVTFKYITNFSYTDNAATYSIPAGSGLGGSLCNTIYLGNNDTRSMTNLTASIYPNPVHGLATLKVNTPQSGNLNIEVTNLVGQTMMNLNKGVVNSGDHSFNLDATRLTSGVYFYTVKLNNQKVTGKMIVE
jgi:hypothetical protein